MDQVLVLNASFEPISIVSWQKAIQLLFQGKVEVIEESQREIRTISIKIKLPSVLRLLRFIPLKRRKDIIRFSRANVFLRDQYTCQYCGRKRPKNELTLDHVIPSVRGGPKTWDNIVTACIPCNQIKGPRSPEEARFRLITKPACPVWLPTFTISYRLNSPPDGWKVYLPWQSK